jgi:4-aminobutyrate aminotransferase-like enzyme
VRDPATKEPDPALASAVKNAMRERGVLVGSTGPHDNVLKVRPPLVFGEEHVPCVVEALEDSLRALGR